MQKKDFQLKLKELGYTQKEFAEYIGRSDESLKKWADNSIPDWAIIIVKLLEENRDYKDFFESHMKINNLVKKYTL